MDLPTFVLSQWGLVFSLAAGVLLLLAGIYSYANHLRSARSGWVTGTGRPLHVGRSTQVWQVDLVNDEGQLVCVSRITLAVLPPRG